MQPARRERRWLRPAGLFGLAVLLSIGQPFLVVATAFAVLTLLAPRGGFGVLALSAVMFALAYTGEPDGGWWYMERGWAILVGGTFGAATLRWPDRTFTERATMALAGGVAAGWLLLAGTGGGPALDALVSGRLEVGARATLEVMGGWFGNGDLETGVAAAIARTTELQALLFPALLALSTFAALGVAWWLHVRLAHGWDGGLGPLREFRFPDPLVWVLVAGVLLVLVGGWQDGWGRLGANLLVFMTGLYVFRGLGVFLFLRRGASPGTGALLVIALVIGVLFAGPLLLLAAMALGLGDSWLDIRARLRAGDDQDHT